MSTLKARLKYIHVEAREFVERKLGCEVSSIQPIEVIMYPDLAGDDHIYEVTTNGGTYWLVIDPSFRNALYPRELYPSASKLYLHHVSVMAEELRSKRRLLSSGTEERVAPQVGGSRRKTKMAGNKPYKTIRSGLIRAVIWKNAAKNGKTDREFYSIQVERLFKRNEESQWESTNSFGVNDLGRVQLVVAEAFKELALSQNDRPKGEDEPVEVEEIKVE